MPTTTQKLLQEESRIWAELEDVCEEETLQSISRLIEINIELQSYSGL